MRRKGLGNLETAIILCAFVLTAAAFAYVILSIPENARVNLEDIEFNDSIFNRQKTEIQLSPRTATHYSLGTAYSWMVDEDYYDINPIPENGIIFAVLPKDDAYYIINYWTEYHGYFVLETTEARRTG